MARNPLNEVQKKMDDLKRKRAAALEEIDKKKKEAQNELTTAQEELEEATGKMDLTAYEKASARRQKAQTALDMYSMRYEQIGKQEYITVQESEEILNSLIKYERQLEKALTNEANDTIHNLLSTIDKYQSDVSEIQKVYREWIHTVHDRQPGSYHPEEYPGFPLAMQLRDGLRGILGQVEHNMKLYN